jgi:hypothetical protein
LFHLILHQPEIPPDTGNVIRLCANTGATPHLVKPLGFRLDAKSVQRSGLDYHTLQQRGRHRRRPCLQTVPPRLAGLDVDPNGAARAGGFSLHAGVAIAPGERARLERLGRYVSRPPVATERLALSASGQLCYLLKTPYRDGTTHLVLEPLLIRQGHRSRC